MFMFKAMDFAKFYDRFDVRRDVTVLSVDNDFAHDGPFATVHYYNDNDMEVTTVVPFRHLIPILEPASERWKINSPS